MNAYEGVSLIETSAKGRGVAATREIKKGERILRFIGNLVHRHEVKNPNAALQLNDGLFLESDGTVDEGINHSCSPNCYIDFDQLALVALRDIGAGEELTFDYNTSEYDLVDQGCPFTCLCGSQKCVGEVKGYRYLPAIHKQRIAPLLSPFLKGKWMREKEAGLDGLREDC